MNRVLMIGACTALGLSAGAACEKAEPTNNGPTAPKVGVAAQTEVDLQQPIAIVGETTITVGEFQERINKQSPYVRARYNSLEKKKEFLDNLIRFEVLAQEAIRQGFDKNPDVVRSTKQLMVQKLMRDHLDTLVTPEDISEEQMLSFYKNNIEDYKKPEQVRVSAIITASKAEAERAAKEARKAPGNTHKGFRELVHRYSVDKESRLRGGDLRYFRRDNTDWAKPVITNAFSLAEVGDITGPFAARGKYYVMMKTGHRRAVQIPFEDAKAKIQNRLYRQRRTKAQRELIAELRRNAKIEVNNKNLNKVRVDRSDQQTQAPHPHAQGAHAIAPEKAKPPKSTLSGNPIRGE